MARPQRAPPTNVGKRSENAASAGLRTHDLRRSEASNGKAAASAAYERRQAQRERRQCRPQIYLRKPS